MDGFLTSYCIYLWPLDIRKNKITDIGVMHLCGLLTYNRTLASIDLQNNGLSRIGFEYLASEMRRNDSLCLLNLDGNKEFML